MLRGRKRSLSGRNGPTFDPVWEVLLTAARFPPASSGEDPSEAARLDWNRVVDLAWQHRVAPILYSRWVRQDSVHVPGASLDALKRAYVATAARNALLFQ